MNPDEAFNLAQDLTYAQPPEPPFWMLLNWWQWLLLICAVCMAIALAYWGIRSLIQWVRAPEPAHKIALRKLNEIKGQTSFDETAVMVQVCAVVCDYLKRRFDAPAPSFTPTELASRTKDIPALSSEHRRWLAELGGNIELSQYAAQFIPIQPPDSLVSTAIRLVEETWKYQPPEEATGPSGPLVAGNVNVEVDANG